MAKQKKKESFINELKSSPAFHIQPKNATQQFLLDSINNNTITTVIGPAGTGKTFITGMKVAQLFLKGGYDNIVISRPNISTGQSLGYFPGTVEEKMEPWLRPIMNVLEDGFGKGRYNYMSEKGIIQIQPLETIRGMSYMNSLIIVDESQNLNMEEIKAVTTRVGENSKLILTGDPNQSDIRNGNDLLKFCKLCEKNGISVPVVQFGLEDIVRSDIVAELCKMFYTEKM